MSASSLYRYQNNERTVIDRAIQNYRSKRKHTVFVEGLSDKDFIKQWSESDFIFDGFCGKPLIEAIHSLLTRDRVRGQFKEHMTLIADIDYDISAGLGRCSGVKYFVVDDGFNHIYNDLDVFLINTRALNKILVSLRIDIDNDHVNKLRDLLSQATKKFGKYRCAEQALLKSYNGSILEGLDITPFYDPITLEVNEELLRKSIPNWSKSLSIDELIETADKLEAENPLAWSLTRGHDATEILASHIKSAFGKKFVDRTYIERQLKLGCELYEFNNTGLCKHLVLIGAIILP